MPVPHRGLGGWAALWVRKGATGVLRAHGEAGRTPKPPPGAAVLVCRSQETRFGSDGQLLVNKQNTELGVPSRVLRKGLVPGMQEKEKKDLRGSLLRCSES